MKIDILRKVDRFSKYPENQSPIFLVFILVFLCNCFGKRFDSANFECYLQQILYVLCVYVDICAVRKYIQPNHKCLFLYLHYIAPHLYIVDP